MKTVKNWIRAGFVLFVISLTIAWPVVSHAENTVTAAGDLTPQETYNLSLQDYASYSSKVVYSYLVDTEKGLMRVEYDYLTEKLVVEYYDFSYTLTEKYYVVCELEVFGGFYAGEDAYYLVFGQNNLEEDDNKEVLRIVKYSTDWEREGNASLYGANTTTVFKAGSLRMAENNGYLYVRTSHEMYADSEGTCHQTNWTIQIQESDMSVVDETSSCYYAGYVSHSLNQFILVDDEENLLALDHGDWYPRSMVMFRFLTKAGYGKFSSIDTTTYKNSDYVEVFPLAYDSNYHYNFTFATVGGFEYSSTSYLTAGSSVIQDENAGSYSAYNIYVTVTSRDDFSSEGTEIKWITNYSEEDDVPIYTPHLVKFDEDLFLLVWEADEYLSDYYVDSDLATINYVFLDGEGNMVSEIYSCGGYLSDCRPVVIDGQAVWYVTMSSEPYFFTIDLDGECNIYGEKLAASKIVSTESTKEGLKVTWTLSEGATKYCIGVTFSEYTSVFFYSRSSTENSMTIPARYLMGGEYVLWVIAQNETDESLVWDKTVATYQKYIDPDEVTLSAYSYTYDGKEKKPSVTVGAQYTYDSEATLVKGTDYTVSYTNNINPGIATVTITGMGYYTGTVTINFEIKPASCAVSSVSNTTNGLKVTWSSVSGSTGYYIYRKLSGGSYSLVKTITDSSTVSWSDTSSLTSGKDYNYKVAAYYETSAGTIVEGGSSTTKTCKYLAGGVVSAVANTTTGQKVTWSKVTGANGYYVYRKITGGSYSLVKTVTSGSTVSWSDTSTHTSGKDYNYKVIPYFKSSSGTYTVGVSKTAKTTKYLTAGKISSFANTSSGLTVNWSKVTGASGYYVYRKTASASSYTLVKTITSGSTVSYTDTAVKNNNNTSYTYYVQPYFKASSGNITKASYTTRTTYRLVATSITSLTNSASKKMTVKWSTKSGVTGYQIQYSTSSSFASGNKTVKVTGASSASKVISSLTKGKTYYVRIRTYKTVNGVTYYSAWCTEKSVKISK